MSDTERERFEAWYIAKFGFTPTFKDGHYIADPIEARWVAWEARAALSQRQPPAEYNDATSRRIWGEDADGNPRRDLTAHPDNKQESP